MLTIPNLPKKIKPIWKYALPFLQKGRPGDAEHAKEVAEMILSYQSKENVDLDILLPVAILHDIGHSAVLPEHFHFITGGKKLENGKIVHMLTGAKIAKDILFNVGYDSEKTNEIVEIISIHDADQVEGLGREAYDSFHKKFFHDLDSLDRFNEERMRKFAQMFDVSKIKEGLEKTIDGLFLEDFKIIAREKISKFDFSIFDKKDN